MKKISIYILSLAALLISAKETIACDKSTVTVAYLQQISPGVYQMKVDWCVGTTTAAGGSGGNCTAPDGITYEMAIQMIGGSGINITSFSPANQTSAETGNTAPGTIMTPTNLTYSTGTYTVLMHDATSSSLPNQYCYSTIIEFTATTPPTSIQMLGLEDDCGASGAQVCNETSTVPTITTPPACAISLISAGNATPCQENTNTYTKQVTVTYANAPLSGTLNVNGQTFAVTGSPQTVTLTNLTANGSAVNVTAFFTNLNTCTFTQNNLYTAPVACGCDFTNKENAIITPSGTHNSGAGFTQIYVLTTSNGVIVATSANGNFGIQGAGDYNAYGLNYETADAPTPLPTVGVDIDTMTGGCFTFTTALPISICCGAESGTITK